MTFRDLASLQWSHKTKLNDKFRASTLIHHPFEPHLIIADENGTIFSYDWEKQDSLGHFLSSAEDQSPLTIPRTLHLINPSSQPILMVGSGLYQFLLLPPGYYYIYLFLNIAYSLFDKINLHQCR